MRTSSRPRQLAAILLFLAGASLAGPLHAAAINGALYTTNANGQQVNGNVYPFKSSVYISGGPTNAACSSGKLDDGTYVFQVTDPAGTQLLSTDGIDQRRFTVAGGVISANLGNHVDSEDAPDDAVVRGPCGGVIIRLAPYANSPNGGEVYKVWITREADFHAQCDSRPFAVPGADCGRAGFRDGQTKTDNFRVPGNQEEEEPPPTTGTVEAVKFYDADADGWFDVGEPYLAGWEMILRSEAQAIDSTKTTDVDGTATWADLDPGDDFFVEERHPDQLGWYHSTTIVAGHDGSPINPVGPLSVVAGETTTVVFGNYCTVPSNGRTLGFWSNRNGQSLIDGGDLSLLSSLNLRGADGSDFDPADKDALRYWLLDGDATNMAYMLSVQLAAMELNVFNGFVDGGGYYVPAGMTVNELMDAANDSLWLFWWVPADHDERAEQEQLKNWLDELNNGAGLLSPTPCEYTFSGQ